MFAAKSIGRGYAALSRFCNNLDLPGPMARRTFGDELADIVITIDGTWMKRGHSSLYGAVALSWQTGKVIDYMLYFPSFATSATTGTNKMKDLCKTLFLGGQIMSVTIPMKVQQISWRAKELLRSILGLYSKTSYSI